MKKTNNLVLKISSLAIAFFVWIVVINISNPVVTRSQTVNLEVLNADVITDAGKTYYLTLQPISVPHLLCHTYLQDLLKP